MHLPPEILGDIYADPDQKKMFHPGAHHDGNPLQAGTS
jgi:hypothetical protein